MITTPQAELERLAAYIYGWKETVVGYDFDQARTDAQAVIDALIVGTYADTVLNHPSTRWVADRFMVPWLQASTPLAVLFGGAEPPTPVGMEVELASTVNYEAELASTVEFEVVLD